MVGTWFAMESQDNRIATIESQASHQRCLLAGADISRGLQVECEIWCGDFQKLGAFFWSPYDNKDHSIMVPISGPPMSETSL